MRVFKSGIGFIQDYNGKKKSKINKLKKIISLNCLKINRGSILHIHFEKLYVGI